MANRYGVEHAARDIEALLLGKLTAAVTAVEAAAVADGLAASGIVAAIPADSYFKFAWNDEALNRSPAVGIFVDSAPAESHGAYSKISYTLDVGVLLSATQNDPLATIKLLRYMEALRNVFEQNWGKINGLSREKLETIGPIDFRRDIDSSEYCKIAGVSLLLTLG